MGVPSEEHASAGIGGAGGWAVGQVTCRAIGGSGSSSGGGGAGGSGGGGGGGSGSSSAINKRVTFGHGARHLSGTGLSQAEVENAIESDIQKGLANASASGSFWGKVTVAGQKIFYRAHTLADGTINVGTYTVGRP